MRAAIVTNDMNAASEAGTGHNWSGNKPPDGFFLEGFPDARRQLCAPGNICRCWTSTLPGAAPF